VAAGTPVDQTCPVSGLTTAANIEAPITDETPAVEVGGRVIFSATDPTVQVLDESYTRDIQASGPGGAGYFRDNYPGTSSEAIGNFRCLYIRVTYPDQMRAPNSEVTAYDDMRNVSRFYLESSFGKLTTTSVVTPLIVLPHTKAWYVAKDSEEDSGVDGLGPRPQRLPLGSAQARVRFRAVQLHHRSRKQRSAARRHLVGWWRQRLGFVEWHGRLESRVRPLAGTQSRELLANLGRLGHRRRRQPGVRNSFDVMGGGGGFGAHYNTISKRALGWLNDIHCASSAAASAANGVYRIFAYDQPQLEEGRRYALLVDKDPQRRFNLEYHPAMGNKLTDSVLMIVSGLGSNAGHLIDTTPGSPGGKGDGGIQIGRTFSDPESDIHFTGHWQECDHAALHGCGADARTIPGQSSSDRHAQRERHDDQHGRQHYLHRQCDRSQWRSPRLSLGL
jgi:hypothetical protein